MIAKLVESLKICFSTNNLNKLLNKKRQVIKFKNLIKVIGDVLLFEVHI